MLKETAPIQSQLEFVSIDQLVPSTHLLRKIEKAIDFSFIPERVKGLYCPDNGRPALDPVVMFKMLFVGYLFGIRSERQLRRDIEVNVAYRWFLGFGLTDKVPHDSTLSQNRRRRFQDSTIYQVIFDEIVLQAMANGLVSGKVLYTDSTHLKASANKKHALERFVPENTRGYLAELEAAVEEDRRTRGKKPLPAQAPHTRVHRIKQSPTDPDAGYLVREGKPKGFFYLDHRTVDSRCNIMTDCHVTPGNVHDSLPYLERLDRQQQRFGFDVKGVGLDAGYFTAALCHGLEQRAIRGVIGYRRPNHKKGYFYKREYVYDAQQDIYRCPRGQLLHYRTTSRDGYRQYHSDPGHCKHCPQRPRCTQSRNHTKVITRHVWEASKERINQNRLMPWGKALYQRRKETVERSFADSKQLHGLRYARMRGLKKLQEQCLLTAACQNMKKIALMLNKAA